MVNISISQVERLVLDEDIQHLFMNYYEQIKIPTAIMYEE